MRIRLQRGNDQTVTLPGLRVTNTESYLNAATVVGVFINGAGEVLETITLTYVAASNGNYEWVIEGATFLYPPSTLYRLEMSANEGTKDFRRVYDVTVFD